MKISDEVDQKRLLDEEMKLHTAVDIGLTVSTMMRLFRRKSKSKDTLHAEIYSELPRFFNAKTPDEFKKIHSKFCSQVMGKIWLAKEKKNASYGQIAKTLDVVLKVVIYYSHFPNCTEAQKLSKWLNVAMDTKMMAYLGHLYHKDSQSWPNKVKDVREKKTYDQVQQTVSKYAKDNHLDEILPSQLEDILWAKVNKKSWFPARLSDSSVTSNPEVIKGERPNEKP